jgi:hypothetical protein
MSARPPAAAQDLGQAEPHHLYFGDLHNHGAVGYARGSLLRSFEIARNHLDFFAFTPHGWWPDIGRYENNIEKKWLTGFDVTRERWPEVLEAARKFDAPRSFVPIVGYEWHSTNLGDYHIIFPKLDAEYRRFDDLRAFQRFAKDNGAILIPHHPANRLGHRGANLAHLDPEVSPVIEMFSEWGNAEHDRAPSGYIRHTEGGRWTRNTLHQILAEGHRLGVVASTDDHLGYPGAYRQGLAALCATDLTREALFDALRNRRGYAVTGDRIEIDFRLNGRFMGQLLPFARDRNVSVKVRGWDQIDRVEILKNNRVLHRAFPMDLVTGQGSWNRPVLLRFEYGWGPWPALNMERVCDWDFRIGIEQGALEALQTCFGSGPYDEARRDRIAERSEHHVRVQSFTALRDQFEDNSTKGIVLRVNGGPDTRITIKLQSPSGVTLSRTFRELAESGEMVYTGDFPKESGMFHRLVFQEHYQTSYSVPDVDEGNTDSWYYVRVVQANNQYAWSSPIWVAKP